MIVAEGFAQIVNINDNISREGNRRRNAAGNILYDGIQGINIERDQRFVQQQDQ